MLFLAGADHERYGKVKWTRRYLLGHRRILKKGDFTTPPVDPIFQKENGGFDFNPQNRRLTLTHFQNNGFVIVVVNVSNRI